MPAPRVRRRLLALLPAAILALAAPAPALACDGGSALPGATDPAALAATTVCLLNEERANAGLGPLATEPALGSAAAGHAGDMVARDFFAHVSPDGGTLLDRLRAAGWVPAEGFWTAGENIAWGTGSLASPERTVAAWMASPGHRANILQGEFDEVGVAVFPAAPGQDARVAGTYVADFGARDDAPARRTKPRTRKAHRHSRAKRAREARRGKAAGRAKARHAKSATARTGRNPR